MMITPLAQVAIYALILSNILAAKLPGIDNKYAYSIYLMAGLLAWTLFSEIIGRCLNLFIEHANLLKKMNFPRITLPALVAGSCLLNNVLLFVSMMGVFILLGHDFSISILWLIPLTFIVIILAIGIGLTLGVMNVFLRDIGQLTPIALQMLFWFTPIIYPINIIPIQYRHWLNLNPMYHIADAYQQILVYGTNPNIKSLIIILGLGVILIALSLFMFRRASVEMVDAL
jgi:lipopolysaccharide transport system permease protein